MCYNSTKISSTNDLNISIFQWAQSLSLTETLLEHQVFEKGNGKAAGGGGELLVSSRVSLRKPEMQAETGWRLSSCTKGHQVWMQRMWPQSLLSLNLLTCSVVHSHVCLKLKALSGLQWALLSRPSLSVPIIPFLHSSLKFWCLIHR